MNFFYYKITIFNIKFLSLANVFILVNASMVLRPRGVPLQNKVFYNSVKNFHCLDGSATIPFEFINDDYCDCEDGSDEPGTAACPKGIFNCIEAGHISKEIPSSRVNDAICDCCDGSDEYNSSAYCLNNCKELGLEAKRVFQSTMEINAKGHQEKLNYIKKAKTIKTDLKKDLENLQQSQQQILNKLNNIKETSSTRLVLGDEAAAEQFFNDLDKDKDGILTVEEIQEVTIFDYDNDGVVTTDEARFYLQLKDSVTQEEFVTTGWVIMRPIYMKYYGDILKNENPEVVKIRQEESHELRIKLKQIEADIKDKEKNLNFDFGFEDEFRPLKDECMELKQQEYTYKICFFGKISQISSGRSEVSVGTWSNWSGSDYNRFSEMSYSNGASCWPGNHREATVSLTCGITNTILSVTEPSRCHYSFQATTPALCLPPIAQSNFLHHEL